MKRRVRFISLLVLASVLACACSTRREREATLKQDLRMMRDALDNYTLDKRKPPQSLKDLVDGHYLKEIPKDPFTGNKDWVPQFDDVALSAEQSSISGIVDVHSKSTQVGSISGAPYNEW